MTLTVHLPYIHLKDVKRTFGDKLHTDTTTATVTDTAHCLPQTATAYQYLAAITTSTLPPPLTMTLPIPLPLPLPIPPTATTYRLPPMDQTSIEQNPAIGKASPSSHPTPIHPKTFKGASIINTPRLQGCLQYISYCPQLPRVVATGGGSSPIFGASPPSQNIFV